MILFPSRRIRHLFRPPTPATPVPTGIPRATLSNIKIQVGDHWGLSSYEGIRARMVLNGNTYLPFGDDEWREIAQNSIHEFGLFQADRLLPGLLELRISVKSHNSDYVWFIPEDEWFYEQRNFQTEGKDTNNNGKFLWWRFDVVLS